MSGQVELAPLAGLCSSLLRPGGRLVLGDMHPIGKCVKTENGVARLEGSYFDDTIREGSLPLAPPTPGVDQSCFPPTRGRAWTIGEIVTAFAQAPFALRALEETPGEVAEIPGMFHLVADKPTHPSALETG